jgi:hypothetical protein
VRERILRRQDSKRKCCCDCGFKLLCIAQRANQSVMRFDVCGVCGDRFAKGLCCSSRIARREQINAAL